MRRHIEEVTCDICATNTTNKTIDLQVIQTTEQNEGRSCKPYLSMQKIDLCDICMTRILSGSGVFSAGAMGYNRYTFKEKS